MNSSEERALLESNGWTYDLVARKWTAPDGFEVTTDTLMIASSAMGVVMERRLRELVVVHGRATR